MSGTMPADDGRLWRVEVLGNLVVATAVDRFRSDETFRLPLRPHAATAIDAVVGRYYSTTLDQFGVVLANDVTGDAMLWPATNAIVHVVLAYENGEP